MLKWTILKNYFSPILDEDDKSRGQENVYKLSDKIHGDVFGTRIAGF